MGEVVAQAARRWMSARQAVSYTGISLRGLWRLCDAGLLTRYRPGGRRRVLLDVRELDALIERGAVTPGVRDAK
jgi:hypothetical protein